MHSSTSKGWHYLLISLVAIGFFVELFRSPLSIIIPLLIIGIVYYLYKFPPRWLLRMGSVSRPAFPRNNKSKSKTSKKKRRPFRVIDGNKKKETL
ncbi:hypothetical protein [Lihuaxuella thermophila]|uniref:Uncharacterized protein n=1 Tax=Lihuaxuella thermophila TaxID=1173111 RepID=A0A1H8EWB5_9BACL|nr:hypothetical protein [Lihuaxuella thermophila]SEN23759.1 hypothetical protein SAMN05444955_107207 [Lihuaxuella thermophila]